LHWGGSPDESQLARFVDALFGKPTLSPTADEHRMFLAYASAVRSGELSRQVGAALVSAAGDVVALGANDVPRRGGGLYWPTADDDRDAIRGEDSNWRVRRELLESVADEVEAVNPPEFAARLANTRLKQITEYGRAVHAEMEALLSCARSGISTRGSTLYVTTFPCHNCARHIIAAGVERVVYVEPYPKSRALELHDKDLIEATPQSAKEDQRVRFEPFLGVGARRFFDYFSMQLGEGYALERMDETGRLKSWNPALAAPRVQAPDAGVEEREESFGACVRSQLVDADRSRR
jgi:deoxycytidylate deaminase